MCFGVGEICSIACCPCSKHTPVRQPVLSLTPTFCHLGRLVGEVVDVRKQNTCAHTCGFPVALCVCVKHVRGSHRSKSPQNKKAVVTEPALERKVGGI